MTLLRGLLTFVLILSACAPAAIAPAPPTKIGVIFGISPDLAKPRLDALRQGLEALGYRETRDVVFEVRFLEGQGIDRAAAITTEVIGSGAKVIVTGNPTGVEGARKATSSVPIVLAGAGPDPVGFGWVASLARPGGNLTGLSYQTPLIAGRRLQFLKDIVGATRIGVLNDATTPRAGLEEIKSAAVALGVELDIVDAKELADVDAALARFSAAGIRGALVTVGSAFPTRMPEMGTAAIARGIVTGWGVPEGARLGGVFGMGPDQLDLYRRSATYIDKILKGASPGDLPLQQPEKFELVVNLRTAKAIGVTVPDVILSQATEIIR